MTEPPASAIDIGDGHKMLFASYRGETAGVTEFHRNTDGAWCSGWVPFKDSAWGREFHGIAGWQGWDVLQREPLTLSPSIQCRVCGNHGFIENGRWRKA